MREYAGASDFTVCLQEPSKSRFLYFFWNETARAVSVRPLQDVSLNFWHWENPFCGENGNINAEKELPETIPGALFIGRKAVIVFYAFFGRKKGAVFS